MTDPADGPARRRLLADILAFHVEAGIDCLMEEEPQNRLAAAAPPPPPVEAPPPSASGASRAPLQRGPATPSAPAVQTRSPADELAPDAAARTASELARSASTLEELRQVMEAFEGCRLKATATRLCFADGVPTGRIMLVGEAPGADEDRQGLPFVGVSGQLLDRMLAEIGLSRQRDVYIANIIPWRPPGNRTPTTQEMMICRPFIERQIELADPDILVTLGGPAALALLGVKGIMAERGRWREYMVGGRSIPALPTLHPAYLLRNPIAKRQSWIDLRALRKKLDTLPPRG